MVSVRGLSVSVGRNGPGGSPGALLALAASVSAWTGGRALAGLLGALWQLVSSQRHTIGIVALVRVKDLGLSVRRPRREATWRR